MLPCTVHHVPECPEDGQEGGSLGQELRYGTPSSHAKAFTPKLRAHLAKPMSEKRAQSQEAKFLGMPVAGEDGVQVARLLFGRGLATLPAI
jgi:hypothetical protein